MKLFSKLFLGKALLLPFIFFTLVCTAFADVTGFWQGSSVAGGATYPNTFVLVEDGTGAVYGSAYNSLNEAPGVITGTISGTTLTFHSDYPTIGYSSDATATTDGETMSGTFTDSQGTSGTFTATKFKFNLTPGIIIENPPVVAIENKTATVTLQKFSGASLTSFRKQVLAAKKGGKKYTIQYDVTLTGPQKKKLTSKRNEVTFKNLKPGNYSVFYKVVALKDGKKAFASQKSPAAVFTIQ